MIINLVKIIVFFSIFVLLSGCLIRQKSDFVGVFFVATEKSILSQKLSEDFYEAIIIKFDGSFIIQSNTNTLIGKWEIGEGKNEYSNSSEVKFIIDETNFILGYKELDSGRYFFQRTFTNNSVKEVQYHKLDCDYFKKNWERIDIEGWTKKANLMKEACDEYIGS